MTISLLLGVLLAAAPRGEPAGDLHVSGTLRLPDGKPAAGVTLFVVCNAALPEGPAVDCTPSGFLLGMRGRKALTDSQGRFKAEKLWPALYTVVAGVEQPPARLERQLELRKSVDELELSLILEVPKPFKPADSLVVGDLQSADGFRVPNAKLMPRGRELLNGHFTAAFPPNEKATLRFEAEGWEPLELEVTLKQLEERKLEGVVMKPIRPLRGSVIDAASRALIPGGCVSIEQVTPLRASCKPDGTFLIARGKEDRLKLGVSAPGRVGGKLEVPGNVDQVEAPLSGGSALTVKIFDENGVPLPGMNVMPMPPAVGGCRSKRIANTPLTDATGATRLGFKLEGRCLLMAGFASQPRKTTAEPEKPMVLEQFRWVEVPASGELTVEFRIPRTRSTLRVRSGGARPLQVAMFAGEAPERVGALMSLLSQQLGLEMIQVMNGFRLAAPDEQGFAVDRLGPGRYTLAVEVARGTWITQPVELGETDQTVTVAPTK